MFKCSVVYVVELIDAKRSYLCLMFSQYANDMKSEGESDSKTIYIINALFFI